MLPIALSSCLRGNDLLIVIQPILREHKGTWHELESYLRTILDLSRSEFDDVFSRLVKSNPGGVLEQMKVGGFLRGELAPRTVRRLSRSSCCPPKSTNGR